jgi:hypothetical protein
VLFPFVDTKVRDLPACGVYLEKRDKVFEAENAGDLFPGECSAEGVALAVMCVVGGESDAPGLFDRLALAGGVTAECGLVNAVVGRD